MKRISFFLKMPKQRLDVLYKRIIIDNIGYNEVVYKENEQQCAVYLLYRGRCKLLKTVKFETNQNTTIYKKMTVLNLEEGDLVGLETIFGRKAASYTLKVDSKNAILFKIDMNFFSQEVLQGLKDCLKDIFLVKEEFLKMLIKRNMENYKRNNVSYNFPRTTKTYSQVRESEVKVKNRILNEIIDLAKTVKIGKYKNDFNQYRSLQNSPVRFTNKEEEEEIAKRLTAKPSVELHTEKKNKSRLSLDTASRTGKYKGKKFWRMTPAQSISSLNNSIIKNLVKEKKKEKEKESVLPKNKLFNEINRSISDWKRTAKSNIFKTDRFALPLMCLWKEN